MPDTTSTSASTASAAASDAELIAAQRRVGELEILLGKAVQRILDKEIRIESMGTQIAYLQKQLFGPKKERVSEAELAAAWARFVDEDGDLKRRPATPYDPEDVSTSFQLLLDFVDGELVDSVDPTEEPSGDGKPPEDHEQQGRHRPAPSADAGSSDGVGASSAPGSGDDGEAEEKEGPKRHAHGRRKLPEDMRTITFELEPDDLPADPSRPKLVRSEVSYRIGLQPAQFVRIAIVRNVYSTEDEYGDTTTYVADPPAEMIPKGLLAPSALAHVVASKWDRSVPYNRFERFFEHDQINLSRSTLSGVVIRAEPLARSLVDAMLVYAKQEARFVGIDASGAKVLRSGDKPRSHVWMRYVEGIAAFVDISKTHDAAIVRELLEGWDCPTVADGASVFDKPTAENGTGRGGCHSHARRKFVYAAPMDSRALIAVCFINDLFKIERDLKDMTDEERLKERLRLSKPKLQELFSWRDKMLICPSVAPQGSFAKALRYLANQAEELSYFLKSGAVPIHNNSTELLVKHYAVGRKSWLFHGSPAGAQAAATWLSLVLSARMHELKVESYFRDLFRVLPVWPNSRIIELAPHRWLETRARLRQSELALEFGPVTIPAALS